MSTVNMTMLEGPKRSDLMKDELLHKIFLSTAMHYPDQVALIWQDEQITYRQLHEKAFAMACILNLTKQIGPGSIVGIRLSRSAQLHVAIIAVLLTGGTYVPFDADTPQERVIEVLTDLNAVLLLIDSNTSINHSTELNVETLSKENQTNMTDDNHLAIDDINADSIAYIICTSGSTGKPKSIAITHRSICHFLRAENEIIQIRHDDIVYQGISAAFDMFFEETFLAYLMGATLVIASKSDALNIDRLHLFMIRHSITVLVCVPTLLLLMNNDSALKLRLINTGGEACPKALVDRWWKEDRLLFNTYGPSETTVSATAILLHPNEPISIGIPLPNYTCCVLDETTGQPTSAHTGELCISGPGVAVGYLGRELLTKEKFTIYGYRTGDLVTIDNGRIFFHGRIDTQVKVRGFRIELDEIEQELLRINDEIQSAAVIVSNEQLIAFIVGQLTESQMRETLTKRLPNYMVPNRLIKLNEPMPRLISGKIDRNALVAHLLTNIDLDTPISITKSADHNPLTIILHAFQQIFSHAKLSEDDDFFVDLGGHSMVAALTITKLRESFPDIAIQDLYECKTAARLAERLIMKFQQNNQIKSIPNVRGIKPTWTRSLICTVVQVFVLIILAGIVSLEYLLPYLFFDLTLHHGSLIHAYLVAYGTFVILPPFRCLLAIMIKWIVIGRYKEGNYPLWGSMYLRWWTVEQFRQLAIDDILSHTPLMATYYRLLGAKIGQNVHLGNIICSATDLLEIGDATAVSSDVYLQTAFVDDYMLKFQRICIGNDVSIGGNSVLSGHTNIEDHSELDDLSFLPPNTCIPSGEVWRGSPAAYWRPSTSSPNESKTSILFSIFFGLIILFLIPLMYFVPMVPGLTFFEYFDRPFLSPWVQVVIFSPVVGILYTVLVVMEIILLHFLLVRNMKEGVYSTNSFLYVRKWTFDRLLDIAQHVLYTFYATLYIVPFLRVLGMKIGARCEFSTAVGMTPSLIEIGDESFVGDTVTLGDAAIHHGQIHLTKTIIGKRVFIGNSAVIKDGIRIPNNCLIACHSMAADDLKAGQSCLGSPAIILPRRADLSKDFSEEVTYHPPLHLVLKRFCIDTLRVFLPRIVVIFEIGIALEIFDVFYKLSNFGLSLLTLPILYIFIFAVPSLIICITLKWLFMGTYKPNQYAMWTWFVWTSEFVTATYEQLAVPMLLEFLQGTLLLAPVLRCFGMKIGRGCFLNTTDITEFDLVHIGDYVTLNARVEPQTHLFEDRVMKVAEVLIEDEVTVGCRTIILPNTRLGQSAKLGPLSLMMKGEGIPSNTSWQGIPIRADSMIRWYRTEFLK